MNCDVFYDEVFACPLEEYLQGRCGGHCSCSLIKTQYLMKVKLLQLHMPFGLHVVFRTNQAMSCPARQPPYLDYTTKRMTARFSALPLEAAELTARATRIWTSRKKPCNPTLFFSQADKSYRFYACLHTLQMIHKQRSWNLVAAHLVSLPPADMAHIGHRTPADCMSPHNVCLLVCQDVKGGIM